jgi:hypothetical protein
MPGKLNENLLELFPKKETPTKTFYSLEFKAFQDLATNFRIIIVMFFEQV